MTLVRFEPLRELETLTDQIQRYFDDLPFMFSGKHEGFSPKIDIWEDDKHIFVEAEIPGIKKEDLKLTLEDNILTIEGEKQVEEEKKEKNFFRNERIYGSFKRAFTLPVEVNPDKINAKFENGILKITFDKLVEDHKNERVINVK
jgi:HSP20 family protein